MDIDAHAKHIARLLEFKEWAEAKIAELEAKLLGEPAAEVAEETAATDTPVVVDEEEKAAE